jgi:hypothetical protein
VSTDEIKHVSGMLLYFDDPHGAHLENQRRNQLEHISSDLYAAMPPVNAAWDAATLESVIDIPSSDDVLGFLRGEVDIEVTPKKVGDCTAAEFRQIGEFMRAVICLQEVEHALFTQIADALPENPPPGVPIGTFRNITDLVAEYRGFAAELLAEHIAYRKGQGKET